MRLPAWEAYDKCVAKNACICHLGVAHVQLLTLCTKRLGIARTRVRKASVRCCMFVRVCCPALPPHGGTCGLCAETSQVPPWLLVTWRVMLLSNTAVSLSLCLQELCSR